ncbi:MAG: hypothetical protein KGI71_05260 [Patescibacteria group bacterium]|nr:hypothetical protein [Patescibacteria group bacterium]
MAEMSVLEAPQRVGYPQLCYRCDRTVAWAKTRQGKKILMDFHPSAEGKFVIVGQSEKDAVVAQVARRIAPGEQSMEQMRFTCHWNTCRMRAGARTRNRRTDRFGREMNLSPFGNW